MQVLIIAGGEGKRMRPITTHKSLLPIMGKSLIHYQIESIQNDRATYFVVSSLKSHADFEKSLAGIDVTIIDQAQPTGMADALLSAESYLNGNEPLLIVSAAKLLDDAVYRQFLAAVEQQKDLAHLAAYQVDTYKEGGYLSIKNQFVDAVIEKPGADHLPSQYYKLVLDYFPQASAIINIVKQVEPGKNDDEYERAVTAYVRQHQTTYVVVEGQHVSLKQAHHIIDIATLALQSRLVPGIHPTAYVASSAHVDHNVQVDAGAKIYDNAVIKGPAYIGRNTVIGNGALVRASCIEEDCQVGYGSEVARSYLGPRTKGHMFYVGDSIVEENVNLSAGTVLANYRFDHKEVAANMPGGRVPTGKRKFGSIIARNTITGVNTSLMPGTVVGSNVTIGSGCVVRGYVPDHSRTDPVFARIIEEGQHVE